ncbi:MAG: efflux RND transporter periplasmic adaptor subunit, partial [Kiritimatiellae bacterium]|nr:efflux RND transporter periplasmic adaptor subunit [Kiritimatiellia bacterium]
MKKFSKTVLVLLLLGAAGFGAWWWYAGRGGAALGGGKVQYKTAAAAAGEIAQTVTANGSLGAVRTVDVGSEVSGKIVELFADYNSAVTNGQLLARLDDSSYLRTREQCEAELESARADLKLAEANFRRAGELRAADLLSDADYDQTEAALAKARASLRQRSASLDKANVDIAKTLVYSPMDGMVLSRSVDVGQTVAASMTTPVLFTLAKDLRDMRIEAEISEADVGGVAEGQEVVFTVDAYPDSEFTGTVSQVRYEPVTSQNVVNYIAIVDVVNADLKLRPGMTANASVVTAKRTGALRVPNAALRFRPAEGEPVADAAPPAPPAPGASPSAPPAPPAGATPKTVYVLDPATG